MSGVELASRLASSWIPLTSAKSAEACVRAGVTFLKGSRCGVWRPVMNLSPVLFFENESLKALFFSKDVEQAEQVAEVLRSLHLPVPRSGSMVKQGFENTAGHRMATVWLKNYEVGQLDLRSRKWTTELMDRVKSAHRGDVW